MSLLVTLTVASALAPAAPPASSPGGDPVTVRDVSYLPAGGPADPARTLDLYLPAADAPAPRPALVYMHGGGWRIGDKAAVGAKAGHFTRRGWVFVSVNYRLGEAGAHPKNARDVAAAAAWVRRHADQYRIDPDRLALMGHSAGAHLASLAAVRPDLWPDKADPDEAEANGDAAGPAPVRAVIELDTAALDVPALMRFAGPVGSSNYRKVFTDDPAVWRDASPRAHVRAGAPPFLLVVAGRARLKEFQARRFAAALAAVETPAETLAAPDRTHMTLNRSLGEPGDAVTAAVDRFLDEHVAPHGREGAPAVPESR